MTYLVILWSFLLLFAYLFGFYFRLLWLLAENRSFQGPFDPDEFVDFLQQSAGWPIWLVMGPLIRIIFKHWDGRL